MAVDGRAASDSTAKPDYLGPAAESGANSSCSRGSSGGSSYGSCYSTLGYPSQALGNPTATAAAATSGGPGRSGGLRRGLRVHTNFDAALSFGGSSAGGANDGTLHRSWGSLTIPQTPSTPLGNTIKGRR